MVFLSTPSARRATPPGRPVRPAGIDFYPRPPRGGRRRKIGNILSAIEFLSTPSARRATAGLEGRVSPRRISIHALREEGDGKQYAYRAAKWDISIHALREEGDNEEVDKMSVAEIFLSAPSARRATRAGAQRRRPYSNFYPRPPRGGRHGAPLSGEPFLKISIHALREEGDRPPRCAVCGQRDFYPRPPRGGRQPPARRTGMLRIFLSTPSARRATAEKARKTLYEVLFLSTPSARRATHSGLHQDIG